MTFVVRRAMRSIVRRPCRAPHHEVSRRLTTWRLKNSVMISASD
jgi:hypothetical protein